MAGSAVTDEPQRQLGPLRNPAAESPAPFGPTPVGRGFIGLYMLAYTGTSLLFLAPLLVSLALKVNDLVGLDAAPSRLALVTSVGSLLSIVANPLFGRLSDRTSSPSGMRRPWMLVGLTGGALGILTVALAGNITVVLVGWCAAQVFFNALLAALAAVMPDQVPVAQRGVVSGSLAICLPIASVLGTFLVQLFDQNVVTMLLVPCAVGGCFVLLFVARLVDPPPAADQRPPWSKI
jgi:MFS family permease